MLPSIACAARRRAMLRRYRINILASKGRFFAAGEPIPDDVSVPAFAEKHHRIREDEQADDERERKPAASERDDDREE